jgi:hypothetical protein
MCHDIPAIHIGRHPVSNELALRCTWSKFHPMLNTEQTGLAVESVICVRAWVTSTHVILFRLQCGHDADSRARIGRFGGYKQSQPDTNRVDPRSRGYVTTNTGFDHPGTYTIDNYERASKALATRHCISGEYRWGLLD